MGVRPGPLTEAHADFRQAADTDVEFKDLNWYFPPPYYTEDHHLTFSGDPRDKDLATNNLIAKAEELGSAFMSLKNDTLKALVLQRLGPRAFSIADDDGESTSFLKVFSTRLVERMNEMYNFIELNGFEMPVPPTRMHLVWPRDGKNLYIRYKQL